MPQSEISSGVSEELRVVGFALRRICVPAACLRQTSGNERRIAEIALAKIDLSPTRLCDAAPLSNTLLCWGRGGGAGSVLEFRRHRSRFQRAVS